MSHLDRPQDLASSPFMAIMQAQFQKASLSKAKYAKSVGISRPTLLRYLQGSLPKRPEVKQKLAAALGVSPIHLHGILRISKLQLEEAAVSRTQRIFKDSDADVA